MTSTAKGNRKQQILEVLAHELEKSPENPEIKAIEATLSDQLNHIELEHFFGLL